MSSVANGGVAGALEGGSSSPSFSAYRKNEIVFTDTVGTEERVFVSCYFHGTNLAEPTHLETHHLASCPDVPHCAYCWHGWRVECGCEAAA